MVVGILALQGAVEPHERALAGLGVTPIPVRTPAALARTSALVLPGGESGTMLHLLRRNQLWEPLLAYVKQRPVLGVCAGCILLAREVAGPAQPSLDALDIDVTRNAFGRQIDSFVGELEGDPAAWDGPGRLEGVFIRAPRITRVGPEARVLFRWKDEPVLVEQGRVLAGTFHPELTRDSTIHRYFLNKMG